MPYPQSFKESMVQRLTGPDRISAAALAEEVGVAQSSLSRWLREARTLGRMKNEKTDPNKAKSTREWTEEEKLRIVAKAMELSDEKLGAFLRREGLHESQLKQWRETLVAALRERGRSKASKREKAAAKRIKKLERELRRKDKALAEVTALLALKKKLDALLGDEDENTRRKSGNRL
jgi:transposase-like protein